MTLQYCRSTASSDTGGFTTETIHYKHFYVESGGDDVAAVHARGQYRPVVLVDGITIHMRSIDETVL